MTFANILRIIYFWFGPNGVIPWNMIFDLLILKINYLGMIRQKRFAVNRIQNNQKTNSQPFNIEMTNNYLSNQVKDTRINENRMALNELSSNTNTPTNRQSFFIKLLSHDNKYKPQSKVKEKENILCKISELIKNEDVQIPICHSTKSKPLSSLQQRPNSSFTRYSRTHLEIGHLNRFSVVLHLSKKQEEKPPQRISTSRALMNYSKVYRNHSTENQGFRVKRDVGLMNRFVHLSAQKMVFHEKEKKEKKQFEKIINQPVLFKRTSIQQKPKKRYEQEQEQFELGGWDYFE